MDYKIIKYHSSWVGFSNFDLLRFKTNRIIQQNRRLVTLGRFVSAWEEEELMEKYVFSIQNYLNPLPTSYTRIKYLWSAFIEMPSEIH